MRGQLGGMLRRLIVWALDRGERMAGDARGRGVRDECTMRGKRSVPEKGRGHTEWTWWEKSPPRTTTTTHIETKQGHGEEPGVETSSRLQTQRPRFKS